MESITLNNGIQCPVIGIGTFMLSPAEAENSVRSRLTGVMTAPHGGLPIEILHRTGQRYFSICPGRSVVFVEILFSLQMRLTVVPYFFAM